MYKDFLMQFAQQQNPLNGLPRTPPNPASLLAAAAGNQNLLQNNPALLHQVMFFLPKILFPNITFIQDATAFAAGGCQSAKSISKY